MCCETRVFFQQSARNSSKAKLLTPQAEKSSYIKYFYSQVIMFIFFPLFIFLIHYLYFSFIIFSSFIIFFPRLLFFSRFIISRPSRNWSIFDQNRENLEIFLLIDL